MNGNLFGVQLYDRPSRIITDEIREKVVDAILPKVLNWMSDDDIEGIRQDLIDIVDDEDGYYLSKRLDDKGWFDVNSELVEILDGVRYLIGLEHEKILKAWVKLNDIKPKYEIGKIVSFVRRSHGDKLMGEITKINLEQAKYLICVESLGHVKKGLGTLGIYVNFEDVSDV